jgi:hypothetical protein
LAKTVAVSFEGNEVKVLHSSLKGNTLSILKSEIIAEAEFDDYLRKSPVSEFLVTCSFNETFHDSFTVPPVKPRYLDKVIESKIRKVTNRQDLSYITFQLGEQRVKNRTEQGIYYFAVTNNEVIEIIDRFRKHNKTVKAIYPSVFSAASLIKRSVPEEPVLGTINAGKEMGIFFMKNGNIHFIRNYDAMEPELSDFDIQNINMTINYCFQNLRINPSSVLLLGNLSESVNISTHAISPLASFLKPDEITCTKEEFEKFLLPIGSVYTSKAANILSKDFKNLYTINSYMSYASIVFIILACLGLGFTLYKGKDAYDKKIQINAASETLADISSIYSEYAQKKNTLRELKPLVDYVNTSGSGMGDLLFSLGSINIKKMKFDSLEARTKNNTLFTIIIKGSSTVKTYTDLQTSFESVVRELKDIDNVEIKSNELNIRNKSFNIELRYKKA